MKNLVMMMSIFAMSANVFSATLLEEAVCRGVLDGDKVEITAHVNPSKWCNGGASDATSVITVKTLGDDELTVISSTVTEGRVGAETMVVHTSVEGSDATALTYFIAGVPGEGRGVLELKEGDEHQQVVLNCEFPEYMLDCEQ